MKTIVGSVVAECRGCRWWGGFYKMLQGVEKEPLRYCDKVGRLADCFEYGGPGTVVLRADCMRERAFTVAGKGRLVTRGTFGCAHFEEGG